MLSLNPRDISTAALHSYLLSAVAPRPIALASTMDDQGRPNLSPFSFFNVFSANPPILIFSPARRVRDNTVKHTLENAEKTKEVVINVVNYDIVHQMSLSSTEYGQGVNEFDKAGLTMLNSVHVKPYRVAESPIQLECKINEIIKLGTEGGAGNLIICELVKLHLKREILNDEQQIDQEKLDLVARAGGSFYSRANKGFFEIPKPLRSLGIGVDQLPDGIRSSPILTGNDLGMLANVSELPNQQAVDNFKGDNPRFSGLNNEEKHTFAKEFLANNDVESAWKVLLIND